MQVQRTTRLCASRDLSEHDIVSRIMRRENYLIGMLNLGVLALNAPVMGARPRFLLTKTLEWNLYWWVGAFCGGQGGRLQGRSPAAPGMEPGRRKQCTQRRDLVVMP